MKIRESVKELVRLAAVMDGQTCKTDPAAACENAWALVQAGEELVNQIEAAEAEQALGRKERFYENKNKRG